MPSGHAPFQVRSDQHFAVAKVPVIVDSQAPGGEEKGADAAIPIPLRYQWVSEPSGRR